MLLPLTVFVVAVMVPMTGVADTVLVAVTEADVTMIVHMIGSADIFVVSNSNCYDII